MTVGKVIDEIIKFQSVVLITIFDLKKSLCLVIPSFSRLFEIRFFFV